MDEPGLHDWIQVNGYMRDDYRLIVAAMAVRQINDADPELKELARTAFGAIPVHGARSFFKAALPQQRTALAKVMHSHPEVTALVIALWSFAANPLITTLKTAAETAGLQSSPEWDWRAGMRGYYDYEEIQVLSQLADGLGSQATGNEPDHFKLAALWLSTSITNHGEIPLLEPDYQVDDVANAVPEIPPEPTFPTKEEPPEATDSQVVSPALTQVIPSLEPIANDTAEELQNLLTRASSEQEEIKARAMTGRDLYFAAVEALDLGRARELLELQLEFLDALNAVHDKLTELVSRADKFTRLALRERPDLLIADKVAQRADESRVTDALATLAAVDAYDRERATLKVKLEESFAEYLQAREAAAFWSEAELAQITNRPDLDSSVTRVALMDEVSRFEADRDRLNHLHSQQREASILRVESTVKQLRELSLPDDAEVSEGLALGQIKQESLQAFPDPTLRQLENQLEQLLQVQLLSVTQVSVIDLAQEAQRDPKNVQSLIALLEQLAKDQRHVETFLLTLAIGAEEQSAQQIVLSQSVIDALLRGAVQMSVGQPLRLLNQLAAPLLWGWTTSSALAQVEICLAFLGALGRQRSRSLG